MPQCVTDYSPFTVRIRPGRMREETAKNGNTRNPSLTGKSSTSSNNSSSRYMDRLITFDIFDLM